MNDVPAGASASDTVTSSTSVTCVDAAGEGFTNRDTQLVDFGLPCSIGRTISAPAKPHGQCGVPRATPERSHRWHGTAHPAVGVPKLAGLRGAAAAAPSNTRPASSSGAAHGVGAGSWRPGYQLTCQQARPHRRATASKQALPAQAPAHAHAARDGSPPAPAAASDSPAAAAPAEAPRRPRRAPPRRLPLPPPPPRGRGKHGRRAANGRDSAPLPLRGFIWVAAGGAGKA